METEHQHGFSRAGLPALLASALLLLAQPAAAAATPPYLEPSKPFRTYFSSSPDKSECDSLKEEWDAYWDELRARHQPCLDAHSEGGYSRQEGGGNCSYAACEPYHDVGSKDVDARTAIRACYAAADEKERAERDAAAQDAENERLLKKQAEENARRIEQAMRDDEKRQQKRDAEQQERDRVAEQKRIDEERREREEKKRYIENQRKSADRRDKARDDYWKQVQEDAQVSEARYKDFDRKTEQLEQNKAASEERKSGLIADARRLVESRFGAPAPAPSRSGGPRSTDELESQLDTIGVIGDRYHSATGQANFASIPMALVKDITRVTFQNVMAIEHVIDDFNRTGSASTEPLDRALGAYGEVFSVENLLRRSVADNIVSNALQANDTLEFLPGTWTVAIESVGQDNIVEMVQPPVSDLYDKLAETWLWPR
ncbi:MAG TPA: hypothetical protein VGE56_02160 [Rhodocyclaceae bacterium]